MFTVTAADHDQQGAETNRATPRSGQTREAVQAFMVMQAGDVLQGGHHRLTHLTPTYIKLERQDGTGGTSWTVREV